MVTQRAFVGQIVRGTLWVRRIGNPHPSIPRCRICLMPRWGDARDRSLRFTGRDFLSVVIKTVTDVRFVRPYPFVFNKEKAGNRTPCTVQSETRSDSSGFPAT